MQHKGYFAVKLSTQDQYSSFLKPLSRKESNINNPDVVTMKTTIRISSEDIIKGRNFNYTYISLGVQIIVFLYPQNLLNISGICKTDHHFMKKNRKYLFTIAFIFILLLTLGCRNNIEEQDEPLLSSKCEEYNNSSADYYQKFYFKNDSSYLDSALIVINEGVKNCEKSHNLLSLRKLSILAVKKDYNEALQFINTFDTEPFSELPYYKNLLTLRFKAMQAQNSNNWEERNKNLLEITQEINEYLKKNHKSVDSICKINSLDKILSSPLSTAISQKYYYESEVIGKDSVQNLILMKEKKGEINSEFAMYLLDFLDEDFLYFIGF